MSTVNDGAVVLLDPNDARVFAFDWDEENLAPGVTIASQVVRVIPDASLLKAVSSIVRIGTTVTVTTVDNHGLATDDWVAIVGASQPEYNLTKQIAVTSATTFTFTVDTEPVSPATGTIKYAPGLGLDSVSVLSSGRETQLRLLGQGDGHLGKRFEIANRITTSESPAQTKERSFFIVIENL
jgi:hypothetical protein